jgi:hypothetical protein
MSSLARKLHFSLAIVLILDGFMMNVDQVEAMFKACMKSDVTNDADDYPRAVIRSGLRIGSFLFEC